MTRMYALAIKAHKDVAGGIRMEMTACATKNARSEEEAMGIALKMAEKRWPPGEGWGNYGVHATIIPEEWYNLVDEIDA